MPIDIAPVGERVWSTSVSTIGVHLKMEILERR
jgi:hypothetical protein